ncbi:hypothetical protein [Candidatus Binatus sp.]|uniref:hypothetical protein n=1 Tax=Candidatus Binatus sp. TaxID=2811406 RepID=UPI003BB0993D
MKTTAMWLVIVAAVCWSVVVLAQSPENSDVNLAGKWKGTRRTTGLGPYVNRVQNIEFDLIQKGDALSGSYKCYAGKQATSDCPNPVGRVASGTFNDGDLKIVVQTLPASNTCKFTGSVVRGKMDGRYSCYSGGSLSSVGVWNASRR